MPSWITPPTFTAGDFLSAADMNTYVRDNTQFLFGAATLLRPQYYSSSAGPLSSTSYATVFNTGTIGTPDYDFAVGVIVVMQLYGNSEACAVAGQFGDGVGLYCNTAFTTSITATNSSQTLTMIGARDRNAGTGIAIDVEYLVSAGSLNINTHVLSFITPR